MVVRRDVKFEEERAFRKSRESEQGEKQVPAPQVVSQVPSTQQTVSQVSRVTGLQSVGIGSPGSMVRPAGSSRICVGSTITGTPYRGSRLQGTPGVGTPASGSRDTGVSTSGRFSDDDRLVWEQPPRTKAPKWLQDTLKEAQEFGAHKEDVRAIKMPNRLGMLLVASTRDSEPSTFEEASQHSVWRDAMMDEYHSHHEE